MMNIIYEKRVGNNIRKYREKIGMTQGALAAKLQLNGCDITRSALAKIKVGQRHIYTDEIMNIKKILKVSNDTERKFRSVRLSKKSVGRVKEYIYSEYIPIRQTAIIL